MFITITHNLAEICGIKSAGAKGIIEPIETIFDI